MDKRGREELRGAKVDRHCPYDESQLRQSRLLPGHLICPCCWTYFPKDNGEAV
jgi:hypothetical protein